MSAAVAFMASADPFTGLTRDKDGHVALLRVIVPPGPELLWPLIRDLGLKGYFTAHDVAWRCSTAPQTVEAYLARLHAAGLVYHAGEAQERRRLWGLDTRKVQPPFLDGKGNPSHAHEMASRIWRALKMAKLVSVSVLRAMLDDRDFTLPAETARLYLNALAKAGYLDVIAAEQKCDEQRFRIRAHMVTGPLPPRLLKAQLVYDPNRQAIASGSIMAEEVRL